MWNGDESLTNAPITISSNDSTFAGNVAVTNILHIDGAATGNPYIDWRQGGSQKAYIQYADTGDDFNMSSDGKMTFKTSAESIALTLDTSQNATFAGEVTLNGTDGHINLDGNNAVIFDNSNNNNAWYIRNGGSNAATLQMGTGSSPGSNIKLTLDGSGNATFAGNVTLNSRLTFEYNGSGTGNNYIETGTNTINFKSSAGTTIISTNFSTAATTFSGSITTNLSSEGTYFTGGSGNIRQLSITSGTNTSAHALHTFNIASSNGKYEFDVNGTTELSLDSSSATFAGQLTVNGGTKLSGGTLQVTTDSTYLSNYNYTFRDAVGINNPNDTSAATSSTTVMAIGAKSGGTVNTSLITTGAVGIGTSSPAALLEIAGSGDALRIESTNTGAAGAQIDLLHFTTSPADEDVNGLINFGGYYTGTTSAYGAQIKSVWTDVSERHGRLEFFTCDTSLSTALTIAHDLKATFAGDLQAAGVYVGATNTSYDLYNNGTSYFNGNVTVDAAFNTSGGAASSFSGDLTVGDELTITTISNATGDPDKFLCASGGNTVGYRTGAQVLSDIGAAPATGGAYLPLAGGTLTGSGNIPLYVTSSGSVSYIQIQNSSTGTSGTSDGLTIGNNGTAAYIWNREQANLLLGTNDTTAVTIDSSQNATFANDVIIEGQLQFNSNDGATCSKVDWLTYLCPDTGTSVNSKIGYLETNFPDNSKVTFGDATNGDLQIYHDGSNSYIKENGTGVLYIQGSSNVQIEGINGENMIICNENGSVQLHYNHDQKFQTTSTGVQVAGNIVLSGNESSIILDHTLSSNGESGILTTIGTGMFSTGDVMYLASGGGWSQAVATSSAAATSMLSVAGAGSPSGGMVLQGIIYMGSHGFTIGAPLYLSTTSGDFTNTAPSSSGQYVRILGYAIDANHIYFDPDKTWVLIS